MLDYKNHICPLLTQAKGDYVMCKGSLCAMFISGSGYDETYQNTGRCGLVNRS